MNKIIYIGLDVDDNSFHGYAISIDDRDGFPLRSKPSFTDLVRKLETISKDTSQFHLCYEAGYLGFTLARELRSKGYRCDVIAPHLIPKKGNSAVKTDRLDAKNLSLMLSKGLLTPCNIPDIDTESVRSLIRSRTYLSHRLRSLKSHIVSLCRKSGLHFKQETQSKAYWTVRHRAWVQALIKNDEINPLLRFNLKQLVKELEAEETRISEYDEQIELLSQSDTYRETTQALSCFRGISTVSAMAIAAETGDIDRFAHPNMYMSYVGLGVREYSSGGKEIKFGITKTGNSFLRMIVVESSQKIYRKPAVSKKVKQRRNLARSEYIEVADKCMTRMNKKGMQLLLRGKHSNLVKVACAREMLGFMWDVMKRAKKNTPVQVLN